MLPDEMTDHVAAQVKEIVNYTVRHKSDMDVEVSIDEVIEAQNDAVSPKCDIDAEEKVNETAAANDEISQKDADIRKIIEERKNTSNKEELRECVRVKNIRRLQRNQKTFPASSQ